VSTEEVFTGIEAMAATFRRLGLLWRLTKGTVFASDANTPTLTLVTLDGDDDPSNCISMVGQIPQGARVYVMMVPHRVTTLWGSARAVCGSGNPNSRSAPA
jgi:hypothetical protein